MLQLNSAKGLVSAFSSLPSSQFITSSFQMHLGKSNTCHPIFFSKTNLTFRRYTSNKTMRATNMCLIRYSYFSIFIIILPVFELRKCLFSIHRWWGDKISKAIQRELPEDKIVKLLAFIWWMHTANKFHIYFHVIMQIRCW